MRTKEEALEFFKSRELDSVAVAIRDGVDEWFQLLVSNTYDQLPDGPGKTTAMRDLQKAHMSFRACIENKGQ